MKRLRYKGYVVKCVRSLDDDPSKMPLWEVLLDTGREDLEGLKVTVLLPRPKNGPKPL